MRVLGIDCGVERTGYGVIESDGRTHRLLAAGVIRTSPRAALEDRLLLIAQGLREVIGRHAPASAAVEEVFHAVNVKTALKLRRVRELGREERERFYILGGAVSLDRFLALADPMSSASEVGALPLLGAQLTGTESLVEMERAIDRAFQRMAAQMYLGDPLALGVVIGYLTRKAAEVSNLRVIAHAKLLGLSEDLARQEIVLV